MTVPLNGNGHGGVLVGVKCTYCQQFKTAIEMRRIGNVLMCEDCNARHYKKIQEFVAPTHCPGCNRSLADMMASSGGVRMFLHWKDGEYQALCEICDAVYVEKRKDLFRDTQFGWDRKV